MRKLHVRFLGDKNKNKKRKIKNTKRDKMVLSYWLRYIHLSAKKTKLVFFLWSQQCADWTFCRKRDKNIGSKS